MKQRKIIHIDMDAFYASVEQRDNPKLRGKPLAVGGSSERGVVAAASYEARKFGVFSAMSSKVAKRKCPELIFVKARFAVYREVSYQIREIFKEYTDLIEPLSLDEAYLDVTENKKNNPSATLIAREIKSRIKNDLQLTASAGISYNKFLAKIASDYDKPDGLFVIEPKNANAFIEKLPVKKFHGVGKVTAQKMNKLGIYTGADLKKWEKPALIKSFGKVGGFYFNIVHGKDERKVNPNRIRKSIGSETTFSEDLKDTQVMLEALDKIGEKLIKHVQDKHIFAKTLTLKVKFYDFQQVTRSKTWNQAIQDFHLMRKLYEELLRNSGAPHKPVRLLGLQLSNFLDKNDQKGFQLVLPFS